MGFIFFANLALFNYSEEAPNRLHLTVGDVVFIEQQHPNGWYFGRMCTQSPSGTRPFTDGTLPIRSSVAIYADSNMDKSCFPIRRGIFPCSFVLHLTDRKADSLYPQKHVPELSDSIRHIARILFARFPVCTFFSFCPKPSLLNHYSFTISLPFPVLILIFFSLHV